MRHHRQSRGAETLTRFAPWLVPGSIYIGICLWLLLSGGLRLGGDSNRYLQGADRVLPGLPITGQAGAFPGYVLLAAAIRWLGFDWPALIGLQVTLGGLALAALISVSRRLAGSLAGTVSGLLYIAHVEIIELSFFVLTDSLYTSGLMLVAYALYRSTELHAPVRWATIATMLGLVTAATRPQGWLVALITVTWVMVEALRRRSVAWSSILGLAALVAIGSIRGATLSGVISEDPFSATQHLGDLSAHIYNGTVVWGDPASDLTMPAPAESQNSELGAVIGYCVRNALPCARLFFIRVVTAIVGVRPYFSSLHNLVIAARTVALYGLAAIGITSGSIRSASWVVLAIILSHLAFIGIIWIDWDGRFMLYVMPLLAIFAGLGAHSVRHRLLVHSSFLS